MMLLPFNRNTTEFSDDSSEDHASSSPPKRHGWMSMLGELTGEFPSESTKTTHRSERDCEVLAQRRSSRDYSANKAPATAGQQQGEFSPSGPDWSSMISSMEAKLDDLLSSSREQGLLLQRMVTDLGHSPKQGVYLPRMLIEHDVSPKSQVSAKIGRGEESTSEDIAVKDVRYTSPQTAREDDELTDVVPAPTPRSLATLDVVPATPPGLASEAAPVPKRHERRAGSTSSLTLGGEREARSSPRRNFRSTTQGTLASSNSSYKAMSSYVAELSERHKWLRTIWRLMEEPELVANGFIFLWVFNFLVLASVILPYLELIEVWPAQSGVYNVVELVIDTSFTLEIIVRFIACPQRRFFFCHFYNLLDILAGPPSLTLRVIKQVQHHSKTSAAIDNYLLCVVPTVRLSKLVRRFETIHLLFKAFKVALEALPVLMFTLAAITLAFASVFYIVEPRSNVPTMGISLYATTMTLTTVGYGDISPVSSVGQAVMCALSIVSTLYLAIPLGIIGNAFSNVWEDRDRVLLVQRTRTRLREMGLSATDVPSLFRFFDRDEDGLLSLAEFRAMIAGMNIDMSKRRVIELFSMLDRDSSGCVSDEEFVQVLFPALHAVLYGAKARLRIEQQLVSPGHSPGQEVRRGSKSSLATISSQQSSVSTPIQEFNGRAASE